MKATQSNPQRARLPRHAIVIPARVAERAATRYVLTETGCHVSTYSTGSHGYAQVGWTDGIFRSTVTAHRAAWVYATGEQIPAGMTIDHLCHNRQCVNVGHLRMLTNFENARRTNGNDCQLGTCKHGHDNSLLYVRCDGRWGCRECARRWQRDYRARIAATRGLKQVLGGES